MPLHNIAIVYRKELTEALRDRRTLISSLLVPLLLFPILTAGFSAAAVYMIDRAKNESPKVALVGGEDSPHVLDQLRSIKNIRIVPAASDWKKLIIDKQIRAAVEIPPAFEAEISQQKPDVVKIYMYSNEIRSETAAKRLEKALKEYNETIVSERLAANHLSTALLSPFDVKQENVAPEEKVWGELLGGLIGYMVVLLCLTGGM